MCHTGERFGTIRPGSIHHFLHLKMPVTSQEYDSCCPFIWCVLSFDFAIWLGTFRFKFSSEFSIFVIFLFSIMYLHIYFSIINQSFQCTALYYSFCEIKGTMPHPEIGTGSSFKTNKIVHCTLRISGNIFKSYLFDNLLQIFNQFDNKTSDFPIKTIG